MAGNLTRGATRNLILKAMSEPDFALLEPHLEAVDLPVRKMLEVRNKRVETVYFPERGMASVVANGSGRSAVEIGVIGREGMTGVSVLLGNGERVVNETYMQMEGHGQRMPADRLREAINQSATLHRQLLAFVHSFMTLTGRTAVSNALHTIEERLARWLLMACDRADGDDLRLGECHVLPQLGIDAGGNRSGGIEKACALYLLSPLNEAPDHPTDDEIERQRQTEHEQDQTCGDAQAVERNLALLTGEAFRQLGGNRAQG